MDIKSTFKKEWYVILVLAAPFIASIYLWNDMPDIVPTHFNLRAILHCRLNETN